MSRIAQTFETLRSRGEAALVPYLTVGYPSMEGTRALLCAIVEAGADVVELGIPFSDPLADGATLQRISHQALLNGASLERALELVASLRSEISVPLVLMSYYNPVLQLSDEGFAARASDAGVDGLIVPDLPFEEAGPLAESCGERGIDLIGMVAPTSPDDRIAAIARGSSGFVYCVSLKGVTGARSEMAAGVEGLVSRVRDYTSLPAVVGFGISTPEQVRNVTAFSDGAVVASALMDRIDGSPSHPTEAARCFVSTLKSACRRQSQN